ncbi:MAG: hypothetical protein NZ839_02525 [Endomicrobia bacterium]|nr:hypothetical protein [Endomicrobiia bacterium]
MAIKIPNEDRIRNLFPPNDPNDKTEINADNIMLIFDKIVDGSYRFKLPIYQSYDAFLSQAEEREIAVVFIDGRYRILVKLNNEILVLGG